MVSIFSILTTRCTRRHKNLQVQFFIIWIFWYKTIVKTYNYLLGLTWRKYWACLEFDYALCVLVASRCHWKKMLPLRSSQDPRFRLTKKPFFHRYFPFGLCAGQRYKFRSCSHHPTQSYRHDLCWIPTYN